MTQSKTDQQFDALVAQVHDWTESAVALDEGHFPNELLQELDDLIEELKAYLDDEGAAYDRRDIVELFATPEMADVIERFPRVRRLLERAWGAEFTDIIEEEGGGFEGPDETDDE